MGELRHKPRATASNTDNEATNHFCPDRYTIRYFRSYNKASSETNRFTNNYYPFCRFCVWQKTRGFDVASMGKTRGFDVASEYRVPTT